MSGEGFMFEPVSAIMNCMFYESSLVIARAGAYFQVVRVYGQLILVITVSAGKDILEFQYSCPNWVLDELSVWWP